MDVCTLLDSQDLIYKLCFHKLMWYNPLKLENSFYSTLLYHQVFADDILCSYVYVCNNNCVIQAVPDLMRAHFLRLEEGMMSQQLMDTVCLLAALQHRAQEETDLPTLLVTMFIIRFTTV